MTYLLLFINILKAFDSPYLHISINRECERVSENNNNSSCKQQHVRLVSLLCKQCQTRESFFSAAGALVLPHCIVKCTYRSLLLLLLLPAQIKRKRSLRHHQLHFKQRSCCCLRCAFALLWSTTAMMDFEMQQQHTHTSTRESAHTQWQLVHKLSAFLRSLIMWERESASGAVNLHAANEWIKWIIIALKMQIN